jgi:probable rRNA maturation factor
MMKRDLKINFAATRAFEECDYHFKIAVRHAVAAALDYEEFPYAAEVSVTLCDNEYIKRLNGQFRGMDKPSDVLSFPMYDIYAEEPFSEPDERVPLGDIVISVERTREQARELGNSVLEESAFLAIHSTLHLLGYDHERSEEDDEIQCAAQREIMDKLDI